VKGGKVYGKWPGLANEQLNEGRDLVVTTDFRKVLGEAAYKTLGSRNLEAVFPGAPRPLECCVRCRVCCASCNCKGERAELTSFSCFRDLWKTFILESIKAEQLYPEASVLLIVSCRTFSSLGPVSNLCNTNSPSLT
jgi:hypothetical protein